MGHSIFESSSRERWKRFGLTTDKLAVFSHETTVNHAQQLGALSEATRTFVPMQRNHFPQDSWQNRQNPLESDIDLRKMLGNYSHNHAQFTPKFRQEILPELTVHRVLHISANNSHPRLRPTIPDGLWIL